MMDERIRIMDFRGTYKGGGGPDKTILLSASRHDKSHFFILVTYLKDPHDHEFDIHVKAAKLDINYVDVPDARVLDTKCLSKLNKLVNLNNIQILHTHDDKTLLYGWILKKRNPALKIIYTCHSHPVFSRKDFSSFKDYLFAQFRRRARILLIKRYKNPIIAVSEATKRTLAHDGIDGITILYNSIDINFWKKSSGKPVLRRELNLNGNSLLIGTVARIAYEKDLPTFLLVAQKVCSVFPDVRFAIVGDGAGNEIEKYRCMTRKMGLGDTAYFTGHRNDLLDVYASFDVFLMTSISENMPNTILEAMAMEVPIVSTAVGGVPEILVDKETGFLAPIKDVDILSRQVLRLLRNKILRAKIANSARKHVELQLSFSMRLNKMEDIYDHFRYSLVK